MQEKEIQITNTSFKTIQPKPGAAWKAFNVYQIQGNDGLTYETTDGDYYKSVSIGQTIKIKYTVETKNVNGKIYSSNKILTPKKLDPQIDQLREEVLIQIRKSETNILAAIRLMGQPSKEAPKPAPKKEEVEEVSIIEDESVDGDDGLY